MKWEWEVPLLSRVSRPREFTCVKVRVGERRASSKATVAIGAFFPPKLYEPIRALPQNIHSPPFTRARLSQFFLLSNSHFHTPLRWKGT